MEDLIVILEGMTNQKNYKSSLYTLSKFIEDKYNVKVKHIKNINSFLKENNIPYYIRTNLNWNRYIMIDGKLVENLNFKEKYYEVSSF